MRRIVIVENAMRGAVEVIELTAVHRPPERCTDQEYERHRKRDQQHEDLHDAAFRLPREPHRRRRNDAASDGGTRVSAEGRWRPPAMTISTCRAPPPVA